MVRERSGQPSFHVAAEEHLRVEFFNLTAGAALGPLTYAGDIVVTCYAGEVELQGADASVTLTELDQAVVPKGTRFGLVSKPNATVQLIWSPPHGATTQG